MPYILISFAVIAAAVCIFRIYSKEEGETRRFIVKETLSRLALAYLSAFFFYYVAVYTPRMQDRRNVYEFISGRIQVIVSSRNGLILVLQQQSGVPPDMNREEMIMEACKALDPRGPAPLIVGIRERRKGTMADYIYETKRTAQEAVDNAIAYIPLMDSEEIRLE